MMFAVDEAFSSSRFPVVKDTRGAAAAAVLAVALALTVAGTPCATAQSTASPAPTVQSDSGLLQRVEAAEKEYGPGGMVAADALRALALHYAQVKRHRDAAIVWQRIVAIQERELGGEDVRLADSLAAHAEQLRDDGQYSAAIPLVQRSLAIREREPGAYHPAVAQNLNDLGQLHQALGRYAEALALYERALTIRERADPRGPAVAESLNSVAELFRETGRYAEAIPLYQRSLAIREEKLGTQHRDVAESLSNLALLYEATGDYETALPLGQRALAIAEIALGPVHADLAIIQYNVAGLYFSMGRLAEALPQYLRSLRTGEEAVGNEHPHIGMIHNALAMLQKQMGDYVEALARYKRSLAIYEKAYGREHWRIAEAMNNLGTLYQEMGQHSDAMRMFEDSLAMRERIFGPDHNEVGVSVHNLAAMYEVTGRYGEALPAYDRSLKIFEKNFGPEHPNVGHVLNSLVVVYRAIQKPAEALPLAQRSLAIRERALGANHPLVAATLHNFGRLHVDLKDPERALPLLARAEHIAAASTMPEVQWKVQNQLRLALAMAGHRDLAIFWGKRSVNGIQELRSRMTTLARELQVGFLIEKRSAYTDLADLLIDAGRLAEAQQVMAMLKEEELHEFLRRDAEVDPRQARAAYVGPAERTAEERWRELSGQLASLGRERGELQRLAKQGLDDAQKTRLTEVEESLRRANQRYDVFVAGLTEEFAQASAGRLKELGSRQLDNLVTLQDALREVGSDTVLLHYVVTERRVAIIVTTAEVQVARESALTPVELNRRVQALRTSLRERGKVLPHAQALYKWLIEPVAADLEQAKAKKLALSLDGTLRYVPFAALHDGKRYLVERYALSVYTEAARSNLRRAPSVKWAMTGLGLTRAVPGFSALPAVRAELEGIRGRIMPGEVYFDEQFTAARMAEALNKTVPVLHIASHFAFRPGTDADSFLVLGDGNRLTLQEMRERRLRFGSVELLTLSACDTAMGGGSNENGAEVEGFGALAQRQGAHAVLATLWPVADVSTGVFMREMYGRRLAASGTSKAEALRHSQLTFLRRTSNAAKLPKQFAYPYYWAPFILMGNWL